MLRVDIRDSANAVSLKLEGRVTGNDAENIRTLMARCHDGMTLIVDLTEVTFIDSVGEEVLSFFGRFGAEFVAQTSYTLDMCERLHLRLARGSRTECQEVNHRPHDRSTTQAPLNAATKRSLKVSALTLLTHFVILHLGFSPGFVLMSLCSPDRRNAAHPLIPIVHFLPRQI